jgi:hypothetical protein
MDILHEKQNVPSVAAFSQPKTQAPNPSPGHPPRLYSAESHVET